MNPRIAVVSLWAEDVPAAVQFYRDVIGLRWQPGHGRRAHFEAGGVFVVILEARPAQAPDSPAERFPRLAFAVDDLDRAVERLRANRVDMPWGIEADAAGRWVMFHDPAGNLIELVQFNAAGHDVHGRI